MRRRLVHPMNALTSLSNSTTTPSAAVYTLSARESQLLSCRVFSSPPFLILPLRRLHLVKCATLRLPSSHCASPARCGSTLPQALPRATFSPGLAISSLRRTSRRPSHTLFIHSWATCACCGRWLREGGARDAAYPTHLKRQNSRGHHNGACIARQGHAMPLGSYFGMHAPCVTHILLLVSESSCAGLLPLLRPVRLRSRSTLPPFASHITPSIAALPGTRSNTDRQLALDRQSNHSC